VREAAEALIPFPSTVLGVEAQLASSADSPAFLGGLDDQLPRFEKFSREFEAVPALGALITAPDDLLRRQAEIGISFAHKDDDRTLLPYALQEGGRLRPTVLAQAISRVSSTPYATHRLLLGPGAGAHLANGGFVPLSPAGEFIVGTQQTIPEVDALNLMTVEMADALSAADKQHLSGGKIIVIGTDDDASGGLARVHAQALAQVLAMPRIHLLPSYVPKKKALLRGAAFIFAGLVICFLAFQSALIWCPPTLPAALLAASALFARVAGRKMTNE
jgi:hypothetical protein